MLSTSRFALRSSPVNLSLAVTLAVWLGSKWYFADWFDNPYKYAAKAASLSATVMMCWCFVLSARGAVFEDWFGGLDKVYQMHKRLGKTAFWLIALHPVFLAMDRLPDAGAFLRMLWLQQWRGDSYLLGHNLGVAAFAVLLCLMLPTLWVRVPYHRWKRSHEWFGLFLAVAALHVFVVNRDVRAYPVLGVLIFGCLAAAAAAYVYIRFLYRFLGPRHCYRVDCIERHGDVLEVTFVPRGKAMSFKPSQFVYLVVERAGISPEPHPYSIACGYNLESRFKLGIRMVGDHTRSLAALAPGDPVTVYGPYGRFSDRFLAAERDCVFIGAGIGITPFLGMWHVAVHSGERLPGPLPDAAEQAAHPEIRAGWRAPAVSLFYVVSTQEQASFDNDIRNEVILSQFRGFPAFEARGHHYELYVSSRQGRMEAAYVETRVRGGVAGKNVFLCGPTTMIESLRAQFLALGVPPDRIIVEDFNLL